MAAVALAVALPVFLYGGSGAALAASGGFAFGGYTVAAAGLRAGVSRLLLGAAIIAVVSFLGTPVSAALGLLVLAALGSLEYARLGTRGLVAALFALIAVEVGAARDPGPLVLPAFLVAMVVGAIGTSFTGLAGLLPPTKPTRMKGVFLFVFLSVGLAFTAAFSVWLDEPRSYWIASIFVFRALAPLEQQRRAASRYAAFAIAGLAASALLILAPLPIQAELLIAAAAAIVGLRFIAAPLPVPGFAFTVAILLGTNAGLEDVVFRAEAVSISVGVVMVLAFLLERLWLAFLPPAQNDTGP